MMPVVVVVVVLGVKTALSHHEDTTRGRLDCDVCLSLHHDYRDPPLRPLILNRCVDNDGSQLILEIIFNCRRLQQIADVFVFCASITSHQCCPVRLC